MRKAAYQPTLRHSDHIKSNVKLQNKPPSKGVGSSLAKLALERAERLDEHGKITTISNDKASEPRSTTTA